MTPEQFDGLATRLNTLERRVDVLAAKFEPVESWMQKSEQFHIETRRNWDTFKGKQDAEARLQAERHEQNQVAMGRMANRIAFAVLVVTAIGLLITVFTTVIAYNAGRKQVSIEKLLSSEFDSVYARSEQNADGR